MVHDGGVPGRSRACMRPGQTSEREDIVCKDMFGVVTMVFVVWCNTH